MLTINEMPQKNCGKLFYCVEVKEAFNNDLQFYIRQILSSSTFTAYILNTSGDKVTISGLNKLSTYDDQTLGRIELGGRYGFSDALSAYGWVNYTFGSDYDATAFGAGVNYAW